MRFGWAVVFGLLLLLIAAVPVLASPSFALPPEPQRSVEPDRPPSGAEVGEALLELQEEEEGERQARGTPAAEAEREASRTAYGDLGASGVAQLIQGQFAEQLELLEADPSRAISDAELERVLGPTEAQIVDEGEKLLVEGSIPVRAEDEAGELKKVDLDLEASDGELSPVNPLVEVNIPDRAAEGIEIGGAGIEVRPPTSADGAESQAHRFGDKDVLYPDTQTDTDALIAPVGEGAELFSLLRSPQSPSELHFHLALPTGAQLHEDGHGGAEVVRGEDVLALVSIPHATDAQGAEVPVALSVEGNDVVLVVDHQGGDFAYPILVDPEVTVPENWYDAGNSWYYDSSNLGALGYWNFGATAPRFSAATAWESPFPHVGASERGLFVHAAASPWTQPANSFGQWTYTPPGEDTFFTAAMIRPFWIFANGCGQGTYPEPHDYAGFWNSTWGWGTFNRDQARVYGYGIDTAPGPEDWHHGIGHMLVIGLGTEAGNPAPPLSCPRDLFAGGVEFWMNDWYAPTLSKVEGFPAGWIKKDATSRTIEASATDSGLGVQTVKLIGTGVGEGWNWNHSICKGTSEDPCPSSQSGTITYQTNGFPYEGEEKVNVKALDPTGKGAVSETHTLLVDGHSPAVKREGQLVEVAGEELNLPSYNLKVTATDGTSGEPNSGVKEIRLYLDGSTTPLASKSQSCSTRNCAMTYPYTLRLEELAPGHHTLHIVAEDQVGNKAEANSIGFDYVPATGMKEEFLLQHIPLPDGEDHSEEDEPHGPEIAVNVATGNLVFHQRDVHVLTAHASLDLERSYNSQQPEAQDGQWGRGWSLAQAPELTQSADEEEKGVATLFGTSAGAVTGSVPAPAAEGTEELADSLHATVRKAGEGYEVGYETREETQVFGPDGQIEEAIVGPVEAPSEPNLNSTPTYASSFGTAGTGNGQFSHPAGVAIDAEGSLWVVDENNNRVEQFNQAGEFQLEFGSYGSSDGQLNGPTAIDIDPEGNLWVVDAGNHRVQEFNSEGEFVQKFGTAGSGSGQLSAAEGIAIDPAGDVFVADTYNARVEEFNAKGEFLATIGTAGSGPGQLSEPTDVALGKAGSLWVADRANDKVVEFDANGSYVRQFGASGTGNGQLSHPDVLTVDLMGDVWVGDEGNGRVQRFSEEGAYLAKFGAKGSGAGQFNLGHPMGIEVDEGGAIWVADTGNNRVQKWSIPGFDPSYGAPETAPPTVEYDYSGDELVEMSLNEPGSAEDLGLQLQESGGGLVSEVAGEGEVDGESLGDSTYSHEADKLTGAEDEAGAQTAYGYDAGGRLNSITLPNGTTATMEYDSLDRAIAVTVDPAGAEGPKTTHFFYSDEPRETVVWGVEPEAAYQIGARGGVFRWQNVAAPPILQPLSGSLVKYMNKTEAIPVEQDETLTVEGEDNEAVASMKVIVDGNSVAAETTCSDPSIPPEGACKYPEPLVWVMNPSEFAAGRLDAEAIVTNSQGESTAEHFFLTVPVSPPPDPSAPKKPSFKSVKLFREEYGLDREHSYTAGQLTKLILELIYEWEAQQPAAMQGMDEWGTPMRGPELSELEYRNSYTARAAEVISEWAEAHAPGTYGGFYVDQRAGGVIYVGFTENQHALVEELKSDPALINPGAIQEFPTPPTKALASLHETEAAVLEALGAEPSLLSLVTSVLVPQTGSVVEVHATNPLAVSEAIQSRLGPGLPVSVSGGQPFISFATRYDQSGPVVAGDALFGENGYGCTAGFSARAPDGGQRGAANYDYYVLTAGHCYPASGIQVGRRLGPVSNKFGELGKSARNGLNATPYLDIGAITMVDKNKRSHSVLNGSPLQPQPIQGSEGPREKHKVCWSGVITGNHCGYAGGLTTVTLPTISKDVPAYIVNGEAAQGDSGGPVWDPETHKAVGVIIGSSPDFAHCETTFVGVKRCDKFAFTALRIPSAPSFGAEAKLGVEVLSQGGS